MKDYREQFYKLLELVKGKEGFGFSRFSDGEMTILQNQRLELAEDHFIQGDVYGPNPIKAPIPYMEEERKSFDPEKHVEFRQKLMDSYLFKKKNYIKGIPSQNEWGGKLWEAAINLYGNDDFSDLSFSNVMINGNYHIFVKEMIPAFGKYEGKIILVANENSKLNKLPFKVRKCFRIGTNCIHNNIGLVDEMKEYVKEKGLEDHLFLFAASSLSNILIHELFKVDKGNNKFLDIGSSLGYHLQLEGWKGTRNYLRAYWRGESDPALTQEDKWD